MSHLNVAKLHASAFVDHLDRKGEAGIHPRCAFIDLSILFRRDAYLFKTSMRMFVLPIYSLTFADWLPPVAAVLISSAENSDRELPGTWCAARALACNIHKAMSRSEQMSAQLLWETA